ncbi:hypothetical protein S83_029481, partial [Arachis hypogaea]
FARINFHKFRVLCLCLSTCTTIHALLLIISRSAVSISLMLEQSFGEENISVELLPILLKSREVDYVVE